MSGESAPGCWGSGSARQALVVSRASSPSARRVVVALGDMVLVLKVLRTAGQGVMQAAGRDSK